MDHRFSVSREELYNLQMELKQVQYAQANYAERILRLEKRQADDSALKSVWNSPFPGVLAGTPQHGPVQIPQNDVFDDLDEQGEQLLGSLHLGPAEEEPVRRGGAASRANSVRFDESALHGSSWGAQNNRHSGDFGQVRAGTGFMMERSLSHKSDGRHSSAGHSVHSHHSVASGRASSIGLDTNFATGDEDDDDSSFDMPGLPASVYVLGTVPSIVRCWLTTDYAHETLLYADICTGSQKSTIDYSLVKELGLLGEFHRDVSGVYRARLDVYLAEAVITRHSSRSDSAAGSVPSMSVCLEMCGSEQTKPNQASRAVRVFIGSDALRAHAADVLFSQNTMVLYSNERDRLRVPFIRPEDEEVFRHITTGSAAPERPKLNANAAPFVFGDASRPDGEEKAAAAPATTSETTAATAASTMTMTATTTATTTAAAAAKEPGSSETRSQASPATSHSEPLGRVRANSVPNCEDEPEKSGGDGNGSEQRARDESSASETSRREASSGIWGSWRNPGGSGADQREAGPLSGYQPAPRGRNMKVLKAQKSGPSSARKGASYEPPLPSRSEIGRRKSQVSIGGEGIAAGSSIRWEGKKPAAQGEAKGEAAKPGPGSSGRAASTSVSLPRSANNPVGVASAFSWMTPTAKPTKASAAAD
ncbi:ubiquitin carboxyl-terminal hydrolase 19 [Trichoderma cornu-damae]|uniref:Ubiquitin carboxyl-terminal hydrolase 19 n=1 Tax=Trichoderma cornu-damae TaxID=654480 RepID=A0A9P8QXP0_9HYPO|nr:ubiquitin carboxyl-terminal hydrolase 19 [Trichoderma cornu-damae]